MARPRRRTAIERAAALVPIALLVSAATPGAAEAQTGTAVPPPSVYGTLFTADQLRDLPSSGNVWSLLETADPAAIVDRLDNGGLWGAAPGLVGSHGSSWTQTTFRLGSLDITDPGRTGTPLMYPDLAALEAVEVSAALMPIDAGAPGPRITLVPRRPGAAWRASLQVAATPAGLQANSAQPGAPSIARYGSWSDASFVASGPVAKDRAGLLVSGTLTRWRRLERGDPAALHGNLGALLTRLVVTPSARDEIGITGFAQAIEQPYAGRALFADRRVNEHDSFWHLQGAWDRRPARGARWSVAGGYQRGVFDPLVDPLAQGGTVERLRDGPIPALASFAVSVRDRWDAIATFAPDLSRVFGGRHAAKFGVALTRASVQTSPVAHPLVAELVAGLAARVWDYSSLGETTWTATTIAAYATDRVRVTPRLAFDAGLRFETHRGSAAAASNRILWAGLSPRVSARWDLDAAGRTAAFGGYGIYRHQLPLDYFAVGDPHGPAGWVHRWNDANGDRVLQPAEIGPVIAAVGPCCSGAVPNTIDPGLKQPYTSEVVLGLERRFADAFVVRFAGLDRREHDLVGLVNVGVTASDYAVTFVPDPGTDYVGTTTPQLLPIYDRNPASFGRDRYVLTNPAGGATRYQGLELTLETTTGGRVWMRAGAAAYRAEGQGGSRGFGVMENDQGVLGELAATPNAQTNARGRLFFDRAYVIKWAASYHAPRDVRIGVIARYQDGQPFARLVVAPDLNQGPEAIQAYPRGRTRFTYTLTLDARVEKGFAIGGRRVAAVLEAFNLLDTANEVEEDVVTGPAFRTPTAVQPPRALRLGLRVDF